MCMRATAACKVAHRGVASSLISQSLHASHSPSPPLVMRQALVSGCLSVPPAGISGADSAATVPLLLPRRLCMLRASCAELEGWKHPMTYQDAPPTVRRAQYGDCTCLGEGKGLSELGGESVPVLSNQGSVRSKRVTSHAVGFSAVPHISSQVHMGVGAGGAERASRCVRWQLVRRAASSAAQPCRCACRITRCWGR